MYTLVKAARACEQIVQQVESAIRSGALAAGERLPSERAFAKEFGVSRMTLRRAVHILCSKGLLEVSSGRGTFVVDLRLQGVPRPIVQAANRLDALAGIGR